MQLSNNIDAMLREVKTHGIVDSKQQADEAAFNVLNEAFKKKLKSIEEDQMINRANATVIRRIWK